MRRGMAIFLAMTSGIAVLAGCGAAEIPEDWVPFTFDGKEYYMQPLTDNR